ncbi:MAG: hypothetical protein VR73_11940 [Gammaproteobacteria bacterium BRH_c0]|nr:MAG: hypothetical protein VR73_11940 [Gammaproteobacteria bacterium BRH_c0]
MTELLVPLGANLVFASGLWLLSIYRRDAGLVDLIWPLMFVLAAWIWFEPAVATSLHWIVLALVMAWGLRLHLHLAWRNLGKEEDRRYQVIRERNSPGFWWKSYFIVFVLQAVLAWVASLGIYGALLSLGSLDVVTVVGLAIALTGFVFEAVGDWQLAAFKSDKANAGKVMDSGLWRYTRHPNYFGDCCFWWGIAMVALAGGHWWALVSPLLMTVLLLKVSGVSLLESDIAERRPQYREYIQRTSAFIPWKPRPAADVGVTREGSGS